MLKKQSSITIEKKSEKLHYRPKQETGPWSQFFFLFMGIKIWHDLSLRGPSHKVIIMVLVKLIILIYIGGVSLVTATVKCKN